MGARREEVGAWGMSKSLQDIRTMLDAVRPGEDLHAILDAILDRLGEIEEKFNKHGHSVQVSKHSSEYEGSGSGFTSTPKVGGNYGCHPDVRIGSYAL